MAIGDDPDDIKNANAGTPRWIPPAGATAGLAEARNPGTLRWVPPARANGAREAVPSPRPRPAGLPGARDPNNYSSTAGAATLPTCNTQEQDFDQCRMALAPGKTTYDVLITTARGNRPQLRTRIVDADLLMLSRAKRFTASPWSKDYARHQGNHRWAAFDYSRNESADLPID